MFIFIPLTFRPIDVLHDITPLAVTYSIWDMNGYCYHTLICYGGSHAEVGQIVILKRSIIVMGNSTHFTVFRTTNFRDHYVYPSEWKGGPVSSLL
ncbi:unnamed protein product [Trichobilharzia regenti]|nr:unnamed protein product [Trichobilharzia regenti]